MVVSSGSFLNCLRGCFEIMHFRILITLVMVMIASPGNAKELTEEQRQGLNNLQHEITFCAVFYSISEGGLRRMDTAEALAEAIKTEGLKNELGQAAAILGKLIGMNNEAMSARMTMAMDNMMGKMDGNFVNYSILLKEYAVNCANIYKNSVSMAEEIMNK